MKPRGAEAEEVQFDFKKFDGGISEILGEEFKTAEELLNRLGGRLYDVVMMCPQNAQEARLWFERYVTLKLCTLEHRQPKVVDVDFASRRNFAHMAVGIAFDMLAAGLMPAPGTEVDKIVSDSRRWVSEGRSRGTGGRQR